MGVGFQSKNEESAPTPNPSPHSQRKALLAGEGSTANLAHSLPWRMGACLIRKP
jgi:hypothetical protein